MTNVSTVDGYPRLRASGPALNAGARACDAVLRLFDSAEPNLPAYNLLCRYLSMLDDPAGPGRAAELETALAFRLKLALAAGFSPELAACARCGEADHLTGFSGAAGGVVCSACEAGSFPLSEAAHEFMVEALAKPLAEAPEADRRRCARSSGRSARRSSITRTCSCAPRPERDRVAAWSGDRIGRVEATVNLEDRVRAWEAEYLSDLATRSYPADAPRRGARQPAADALPARPRPDRPLEGLPPPQAQDAGLHRPRGRPLPDPAHPHARGLRDRPHGRPGAGPQRGPDRGDRARPRPRPPALRPHRRGRPRRRPARARRRAASGTTSTRCGSSTSLERDGAGPQPDRARSATGSSTTPAPSKPATLEGRIVKLVDRVAYINHDIDDALRAGILQPEDLPAAEIELLGPTGSARIDTLVRDIVDQLDSRPATSSRARRSAARCCACASSCSTASTSARRRCASRSGCDAPCAALFDHYLEHPEEVPRVEPGADDAQRVTDYLAGMTDRFCIARFSELAVPEAARF